MDEADMAQEHMEREHAGRIAAARKPAGPRPIGRCHYCNCTVTSGLFCDSSCRDDYDAEQRVLAIGGKT